MVHSITRGTQEPSFNPRLFAEAGHGLFHTTAAKVSFVFWAALSAASFAFWGPATGALFSFVSGLILYTALDIPDDETPHRRVSIPAHTPRSNSGPWLFDNFSLPTSPSTTYNSPPTTYSFIPIHHQQPAFYPQTPVPVSFPHQHHQHADYPTPPSTPFPSAPPVYGPPPSAPHSPHETPHNPMQTHAQRGDRKDEEQTHAQRGSGIPTFKWPWQK